MKEGLYVSDSVTISAPKRMLLTQQVSEVSKQISEWLKSLGKPVDRSHILRLRRFEEGDKEYRFHYEIVGRKGD